MELQHKSTGRTITARITARITKHRSVLLFLFFPGKICAEIDVTSKKKHL
jgi:hypothetical protein